MRSPHGTTASPTAPQLEKAWVQYQRPNEPQIIKKKKKKKKIKEMQIKTTVSRTHTPIRMAKIKRTYRMRC